MNKFFKVFFDIIFVIIILMLVGYLILRFTGKVEIYSVKTGSMEDNIHAGDYVLIFKKNDYKVNDIVTYKQNDFYVTHRIISKENDKYVTKGDANNMVDDEIKHEQIIGKVIISGGLLNIIIDYKYVIVGIFLIIYLLSCYFEKEKYDNQEIN